MKEHNYKTSLVWSGARKSDPVRTYKSYSREYSVTVEGKPTFRGSSDPAFLGDPSLYNPEDMLMASISSCHMLWYLHLCTVNDIVVTDYRDEATGIMVEDKDGAGRFTSVTLNPVVTIETGGDVGRAESLHHDANKMCFIANSLNFKIAHEAIVEIV